MDLSLVRELVVENDTKILLLVIDGLGGLPHPDTGRTELEAAHVPHLNRLAAQSACGLTVPVAPGVTPGSGPGHLALFGYDPLKYLVGRGVLEALGIDFDLKPQDVAARGNFCTVDAQGRISDRRAGRISTETCAELCTALREVHLPGVELFVEPVREHRFLLVLRGEGLDDHLSETDPQREGQEPLSVRALAPQAEATARLVNDFIDQARRILVDRAPPPEAQAGGPSAFGGDSPLAKANMVLLRGFSKHPAMPSMAEAFKLRAAAVASYPMYRGLAKLVGMSVLPCGTTVANQVATLRERWDGFDFFFVHYKGADTAGEDGDFEAKMAALEQIDVAIPDLLELKPDVFIVAGDHSTPSVLASHSWHPVPFLMHSRWIGADGTAAFNESSCAGGILGTFPATDVLPLALAHARRLTKYGA